MKLVTAKQMRELDRAAIEGRGIPSLTLMERAGEGVAQAIQKRFLPKRGAVVIVAGRGNNGGDGLVAARCLISAGIDVSVILLSSPNELSPDARANWELLAPLTTHLYQATTEGDLNFRLPMLAQAGLIADAILGTGITRNVSGLVARAIEAINSIDVPVVAIDVPSGLSADDGHPLGDAVAADATIALGLPKLGLFVGEGPGYAGRVEVVDIGIPAEETARIETKVELIDPSMFRPHFAPRRSNSHKGDFGHVLVFAGSRGHLGAGYLAALAALRAGSGLATYCLPERAFTRFDARYPEIMCDSIPDDGTACFHPDGLGRALEIARGKDAVALGPAIGTEDFTRAFVKGLIRKLGLPLVIDADGLNALGPGDLRERRAATILTPHPGEMSRLMGAPAREVQADRFGYAARLSSDTGAMVILKGKGTIVASPDGAAAINPTGNAGMATAGMGDALTGIVASFVAQGMDLWTASVAAVYIHGLAGDMAVEQHSERALITSDVIKCLGAAIKQTEST